MMNKIILYVAIYVPLVVLMSIAWSLIGAFIEFESVVWVWDWAAEGRGFLLFVTAVFQAIVIPGMGMSDE